MTKYWLMKSEPSCFSIDDLSKSPNKIAAWDGVRNYQARNYMRDKMQIMDKAFFYHSSCKVPGIVGICEIASLPYPDHTAWDIKSAHPDIKSTPENPIWCMIDVKFIEKFPQIISLEELRKHHELADFKLLQKGNRLSILPVSNAQWEFILKICRQICYNLDN